VAAEARAALAAIGDHSVVAALVEDVERGHPYRRQTAALALFRLGEASKAARALADADPGVRIAVSCGVLAQRER
jgi:HEAT repeat protein